TGIEMSKQTNEFQELVASIQRALAPHGAKVRESVLIQSEGLEDLREVDILIEGAFGEFEMKVAVEAKDLKRKFDVGLFDKYLGQYRGECRVCVDKFVIVTGNGFTEGTIEKAKATNVELITLEEVKNVNWAKVTPGVATFSQPLHVRRLEVIPAPNVSMAEL